jgi:hypothetical protein
MRTLRLSLAGAVILALLGGLSVAVVAQADEEQAPTATYVTGGEVSGSTSGPYVAKEMDWSDPRLPSRMREDFNIDEHVAIHPDGLAMAGQMARTYRLDGPEGAWAGTGRVLGWMTQPISEDEHSETWVELLTLTGEGAYEGLSATLVRVIYEGDISPYEGFIFEGGLPPMPDPVEPTSE